MDTRLLSFFRRLRPFGKVVAVLLGVLVIAVVVSTSDVAQQAVGHNQANTPTPTPTATPTPTPTPTPPPPLVYLAAHGNVNLREIALTFDDGPAQDYTEAVLGVLRHYHIPATFFMLGIWVQRYPDLARAVVADGDAIGDHTWNHLDLTQQTASQVRQQLTNTRSIIQKVTGVTSYLFRPPYEAFNRQVLDIAHALTFSTILWNVDPRDWARPGVGAIVNNILTNTHNGSIILMHDGGGDRSQTVAALSTIIGRLQKRGFTFVTIPQMLRHLQTNTVVEPQQQAPNNGGQQARGMPASPAPAALPDVKLAWRLKVAARGCAAKPACAG
ncbi:MAG TPA: polysaccharide deacetylase family protein [Ktedonobacterales bacterium]|nr:polysaccharide deacetylase family protein [Ktedonobacterales bacterium]